MKFLNIGFGTICLFTFLVGCSPDDKKGAAKQGADSAGNCTPETVSQFNDIKYKTDTYLTTKSSDSLVAIQTACTKLQTTLGTNSCNAMNVTTNQPMVISYSARKELCDTVSEQIANETKAKNRRTARREEPSYPQPTPKDRPVEVRPAAPVVVARGDLRKATEISSRLVLVVKDQQKVNQLLQRDGNKWVQEGEILQGIDQVRGSTPICAMEKHISSFEVRDRDNLKVLKIVDDGVRLVISGAGSKYSVICIKHEGEWTVQDLRDTFSGILEIKILDVGTAVPTSQRRNP